MILTSVLARMSTPEFITQEIGFVLTASLAR